MSRFALVALVFVVACASIPGAVRQRFSATYTCPEQAVVITPRPDVKAHTLTAVRDDPPADVIADPTRLRLWNERQTRHEVAADGADDVFDATGCGHQERYACHRDSEDTNTVDCEDGELARATAGLRASHAEMEVAKRDLVRIQEANANQERVLAEQQEMLAKMMQARIGFSVVERPDGGVSVNGIRSGGPADGKLDVGDVIVSLGGDHIANMVDFALTVRTHRSKPVTFTVKRGDDVRDVSFDLP